MDILLRLNEESLIAVARAIILVLIHGKKKLIGLDSRTAKVLKTYINIIEKETAKDINDLTTEQKNSYIRAVSDILISRIHPKKPVKEDERYQKLQSLTI